MLEPDSAHNNAFDAASSRFFYRRCQELAAPLAPFPDPLGPFPDPFPAGAWRGSPRPLPLRRLRLPGASPLLTTSATQARRFSALRRPQGGGTGEARRQRPDAEAGARAVAGPRVGGAEAAAPGIKVRGAPPPFSQLEKPMPPAPMQPNQAALLAQAKAYGIPHQDRSSFVSQQRSRAAIAIALWQLVAKCEPHRGHAFQRMRHNLGSALRLLNGRNGPPLPSTSKGMASHACAPSGRCMRMQFDPHINPRVYPCD